LATPQQSTKVAEMSFWRRGTYVSRWEWFN